MFHQVAIDRSFLPLCFAVGRLLHPGTAELPADPGQGGGRAAGGVGPPIRRVPPQTAGGAAAAPSALLRRRALLPPGGLEVQGEDVAVALPPSVAANLLDRGEGVEGRTD